MVDLMNYDVEYQCSNCYHKFNKKLKKGTPAKGAGGVCPNCGCKDGQEEVGQFIIVEEARLKILLENRHQQGPFVL
jgi:DNA-directed RNA polymerase subunit RPC12/RpoP